MILDPITLGLGRFQFPNDTWYHLAIVKAGRADVTSNRNKVSLFLRKTPCLRDDDQGGVPNITQYDFFPSFLILAPNPATHTHHQIHTSRVDSTRTNIKITHS